MAFLSPHTLVPTPPFSSEKRRNTLNTSLKCSASQHQNHLQKLIQAAAKLEKQTRPGQPSHTTRYESLPDHVKTPSQMLGRMSEGCEGTNSVFPKCNFSCSPCYHSSMANKVRTDGFHTITEVARQMKLLQQVRGGENGYSYAQLIGGEVSLLPPEDHALVLETMRFFGRIPMSFTHGDFDYDYLRRLAVLPSGRPRFSRIDFAVHFDIGMKGRKGAKPNMTHESQLTPFRHRFVSMFKQIQKEYGVRSYLAHNMTVQPTNLHSLSEAVEDLMFMGFRMLSFQPAALQGARQVDSVRDINGDDDGEYVWKQIEKGVGIRLSYSLFQMGDVRCNRMSVCGAIGAGKDENESHQHRHRHVFLFFDDQCAGDEQVRDCIMNHIGNIVLPPRILALKAARVIFFKPWLIIIAIQWCLRIVKRAKGIRNIIVGGGIQPLTIVMHRFMDEDDVQKAWDLMERGVPSDDQSVEAAGERVRETMERLGSCSYAMAHPDEGRVVPACVQHSVYDPEENVRLAQELLQTDRAKPAKDANIKLSN